MELYFVRHIKPDIAEGICYGHKDVTVPEGIPSDIISLLPADADIVYSSPLVRCTTLAKQLSAAIITDARLMELHFGDWEGLKWDEIERAALDSWGEDYIHTGPPNGESLSQLLERLHSFIQDIKQQPFTKVIIVTHSGIIRCAMHLFNHIPLHQIMMEKVNFGGIYTFQL